MPKKKQPSAEELRKRELVDAKMAQIMRHPDYTNSRAISSILSALDKGVSLDDEERLFLIADSVWTATRDWIYKGPSYRRHKFKRDLAFIRREFKDIL